MAHAIPQSIPTGVCAEAAAVPATMSESSVSLRMRGRVTRTFRRLWTAENTSKSVSATTVSSAESSSGVAGTHLMPKIGGGQVAARLQTGVCVMPTPPRVGVAFLQIGERAAIADWLRAADIEPVMLVEACLVNAGVAGMALECVIADAALLTREYLAELRRVDAMLPVVAVGDADGLRQADLERRSVAFHARPVDERTLLLAVSLAFAEGRPARRSLRRLVPRLRVGGCAGRVGVRRRLVRRRRMPRLQRSPPQQRADLQVLEREAEEVEALRAVTDELAVDDEVRRGGDERHHAADEGRDAEGHHEAAGGGAGALRDAQGDRDENRGDRR